MCCKKISFEKEKIKLDADINAATVKLDSEKKSLAVEIEKLAEIKDMIEKCTIKVPEGVTGQVVFAKESSRGGNDWILEEGTSVRQKPSVNPTSQSRENGSEGTHQRAKHHPD